MKKVLVSILFLIGMTVPYSAMGQPAEDPVPAETTETVVTPVETLTQKVDQLQDQVWHLSNQDHTSRIVMSDNIMAVLIVLILAVAVIALIFFFYKIRYHRSERIYELNKLQIERGEQVTRFGFENPVSGFLKGWMIFLVICSIAFFFIAFGLGIGMRHSSELQWGFLMALAMTILTITGVILTYRAYVKRRDENR